MVRRVAPGIGVTDATETRRRRVKISEPVIKDKGRELNAAINVLRQPRRRNFCTDNDFRKLATPIASCDEAMAWGAANLLE